MKTYFFSFMLLLATSALAANTDMGLRPASSWAGANLMTATNAQQGRSMLGISGGPNLTVTKREILHLNETLPAGLPSSSQLISINNATNTGALYVKKVVGAGGYQATIGSMASAATTTLNLSADGMYLSGTPGDLANILLSSSTALESLSEPATNIVEMPQNTASHIYPYPTSYSGSGTFASGTTYRTVIQGSNTGARAPYSGTITGVEFWYNNASTNWSELYIDTWRNVSGNDYQLISRSENLNTQLFAHGAATQHKSIALTCNALAVTAGDYVGITILSGDGTSRVYTSTKTTTGANSISYFSASSSIGDTKTFTLSANSIWFLKYTLIYPSGGLSSTATVQMPWNATYNFTTVAGTPISSGTYYVMLANRYGQRAPFSGWLDKVSFISISNVNLTNLTIMGFRDLGTGNGPFMRTWVSGDLKTQQSGSGTNIVNVTLDAPKWVNSGDCIGVQFMLSSSGQSGVYAADPATDANNNACYYINAEPSDWLSVSGSVLTSSYFPIKLWMRPPLVTLSGDSLIRGYHGDGNYYGATAYQMEKALGLPVHGNGVGSQQFQGTGIADRFSTNTVWNVVNSGAKIAIVEGGVNDLAQTNLTVSGFTNTWVQGILLPAQTAGMYVVGSSIWPWTGGTTAQMQLRDQCNDALESLLAEFPDTALYVNLDSTLGQYDPTGDAGNLWDIKTEYRSGDNIHLNTAGYTAFSTYVASQMLPWLERKGIVP